LTGNFPYKRHVAGALCGPLVGLLEEECADEPDNGRFVETDADDIGAARDLAIEALQRIGNRYEDGGACLSGWDSFSPGVW
jgi:hypothetical protein